MISIRNKFKSGNALKTPADITVDALVATLSNLFTSMTIFGVMCLLIGISIDGREISIALAFMILFTGLLGAMCTLQDELSIIKSNPIDQQRLFLFQVCLSIPFLFLSIWVALALGLNALFKIAICMKYADHGQD